MGLLRHAHAIYLLACVMELSCSFPSLRLLESERHTENLCS